MWSCWWVWISQWTHIFWLLYLWLLVGIASRPSKKSYYGQHVISLVDIESCTRVQEMIWLFWLELDGLLNTQNGQYMPKNNNFQSQYQQDAFFSSRYGATTRSPRHSITWGRTALFFHNGKSKHTIQKMHSSATSKSQVAQSTAHTKKQPHAFTVWCVSCLACVNQ